MKKSILIPLFLSPALVFFGWVPAAFAATLSFSAPTEVAVGELFSLNILVDSKERGFNAAEASILFPNDVLEVVSVDTVPSSTIFNFWLSVPSFSNEKGIISFSGGTTHGVVSSSAQILSLHMRAKGTGEALITASDASINASDGSGTNILDSIKTLRITVAKATVVVPPPASVSPLESEARVQESLKPPAKGNPCLGFFTNCDFPFPKIESVSVTPNRQLGSDIFVAGTAAEGAHVRLRLYRSGVLYKEIVTIVDAGQKWEGVLSNIPAYGEYSLDAIAESDNRASQPATWADIHIAPPYTVYILGSYIHWYILVEILLGVAAAVSGGFWLYRSFVLRKRYPTRMNLVITAVVCTSFIAMSTITYLFWREEAYPPAVYWKNTDIPCLGRAHSDEAVYSSVKISIYVDDILQGIPTEIGISPQCVAQIHTHDDIGYLHFEQQVLHPVTLASFFTVAGEPLERKGYTLSITINGKDYTDTADTYALQNGDVVVVRYVTSR